MRNLLFVCARNRLRSPTAEAIFAAVAGVQIASAGTAPDAECLVSSDLVEWAHEIFVMEQRQRKALENRFAASLRKKRVVCLNVPDRYGYMQPELIAILRERMAPFINAVR